MFAAQFASDERPKRWKKTVPCSQKLKPALCFKAPRGEPCAALVADGRFKHWKPRAEGAALEASLPNGRLSF